MNKIDEIALRVAAEIGAVSYSPPPFRAVRGYSFTYDDLWRFTRALVADPELLAELGTPLFTSHAPVIASEQKPVAWVIECEEYNLEGKRPILREIDYFNEIVDKLPAGTKLFTSPPNIEDIEQRVAEACAKLIVSDNGKCDSHVIASQLVCGEWRKYLLPSKNKWTAP